MPLLAGDPVTHVIWGWGSAGAPGSSWGGFARCQHWSPYPFLPVFHSGLSQHLCEVEAGTAPVHRQGNGGSEAFVTCPRSPSLGLAGGGTQVHVTPKTEPLLEVSVMNFVLWVQGGWRVWGAGWGCVCRGEARRQVGPFLRL